MAGFVQDASLIPDSFAERYLYCINAAWVFGIVDGYSTCNIDGSSLEDPLTSPEPSEEEYRLAWLWLIWDDTYNTNSLNGYLQRSLFDLIESGLYKSWMKEIEKKHIWRNINGKME